MEAELRPRSEAEAALGGGGVPGVPPEHRDSAPDSLGS